MQEFATLKSSQSGRVKDFDTSPRWLMDIETRRNCTYCVIVTDEQRSTQTQMEDAYQIAGVIVIYAHDTLDSRATLDLMIEDAIAVLRRAFLSLTGEIQNASVDSITTSEASSAEGDWPQAVIRWICIHQRAGMV